MWDESDQAFSFPENIRARRMYVKSPEEDNLQNSEGGNLLSSTNKLWGKKNCEGKFTD